MYVNGAPRTWLRLEGLAILAASLLVFHWQLGSWRVFALLFLAPDISLAAYWGGPAFGARVYNIAHSLVGPVFLAAWGIGIGRADVVPLACIWLAHVGFDRMLGFGLKYPSAFRDTHLGPLGGVGE